LVQACASCHNDVLDQTVSRARFNVNVGRLSRAELDVAIERVERSGGDLGAMPPPGARQLDGEARARVIDYLRRTDLSVSADPMLERAAMLGMTGGGLGRR
jgi:mono/diheme cytochrome c family protein